MSEDVREIEVAFDADGERIEATAWLPDAGRRRPGLVLFGHGLAQHRRSAFQLPRARRLAAWHGIAAAAIDAPCHGARAPAGATPAAIAEAYRRHWREHGGGRISRELAAAAACLRALPEIGDGPLGYWGLSLGTQYGVAFLAADATVRAAALGLFGLVGPRVAAYAEQVRCPIYFVQQQHDELHSPESSRRLFERLASADKRLHASPGRHEAVPEPVHAAALDFLAARLAEASRPG